MRGQRSSSIWGLVFLWVVVVFLGLIALSAIFWLFATPVGTGVEVSVDGQVVQRESQTDFTALIFPAGTLVASLLALAGAVLALRRALGGGDKPGRESAH